MFQSRTHTCGELRLSDAGRQVTLAGWMENVREVGSNFAFVILRDFYGTTQIVVETEEMMRIVKSLNKESTIQVTGVVRERASKNPKLPTGEIEVSPPPSRSWAAAATTSCPSKSTAAARPTRPSACATATSTCATPT